MGTVDWPAIGPAESLRPGPVAIVFQGPSLLAGPQRGRERRPAADPRGRGRTAGRRPRPDGTRAPRARRAARQAPGGDLRRAGAAGRDRPRPRRRAASDPRRRADRPARPRDRRPRGRPAPRGGRSRRRRARPLHPRPVDRRSPADAVGARRRRPLRPGGPALRAGAGDEARTRLACRPRRPPPRAPARDRGRGGARSRAARVDRDLPVGDDVEDDRPRRAQRAGRLAGRGPARGQAGAGGRPHAKRSRRCGSSRPCASRTTTGLVARTGGTVQRTGPGKVLGMSPSYPHDFPGSVRLLAGSAHGPLLAQQTAANLQARPGDRVSVGRAGLRPATVRIAGVVDLPAADSLFQNGRRAARRPAAGAARQRAHPAARRLPEGRGPAAAGAPGPDPRPGARGPRPLRSTVKPGRRLQPGDGTGPQPRGASSPARGSSATTCPRRSARHARTPCTRSSCSSFSGSPARSSPGW